MSLKNYLKEKNMSMYRLARESEVPYTTINDMCNERTSPEKCSGETLYRICKTLDISIEELLDPYMQPRMDFELFKSNVCHYVNTVGDIEFMVDVIQADDIRNYFDKKWYRESLYLLGMLDYLSRVNNIPKCTNYDDIRNCKLEETVYPAGVVAMCSALKSDNPKEEAVKDAIPEFLKFNIVESEVRNVV